jgi:hypothetical protein
MIPVTIPEPYCKPVDNSVASQYSKGYEDNVSNIQVLAGLSTYNAMDNNHEYTLSIYDIKMERV